MSDRVVIPRHLGVLAEVWKCSVERLASRIAPPLAVPAGPATRHEVAAFTDVAQHELDVVRQWIERVSDWFEGPLTAALEHSEIEDPRMQDVAGRIQSFTDELVERRKLFRMLAESSSFAKLAPRLDTVHAALLKQLHDFMAAIVDALGPTAMHHPNAKRSGDTMELSFHFKPDIERPIKELCRWMERSRRAIKSDTRQGFIGTGPRSATHLAATRGHQDDDTQRLVIIAVCVVAALLGTALYFFGVGITFWILVLLGVLVFIIRHPFISLLALLFGMS